MTKPINPIHDYALTLMTHVVQEQINGGTDWREVAAFTSEFEAKHYAGWLTEANGPDLPYVVSHIGTRHGNPDEEN